MKTAHFSQRGFTMIEILLAMMLIGTTGVGLLSAFANSNRVVQSPENAAFYVGSKQLASLNEAVRQDWWGVGGRPLSPGTTAMANETVGTWTFTPAYTVTSQTNGDATEDYRQARITVNWP